MSEGQNQFNEAFDGFLQTANEIGKQHSEILNKAMGALGPMAPAAGNILNGATDMMKSITDMAGKAVDNVTAGLNQNKEQ